MANTDLAIANSRLDDSLFSKDLAPHYMQLAGKLASSALVPKSFQNKPQDLFICWAMGYQIGISPEQSMQCIAVINGRPAMWGDDMLALCMTHKDFEDIIEQPILKDGTVFGFSCIVKRKGMTPKENIFTLDMAKKAGLLGKTGPWSQYPERMLKLRARGFSLRDAFPDALKGIKPREEVEDYIDAEYSVVDQKGTSRTEILKRDFLVKTGKINAEDSINDITNNDDFTLREEDAAPAESSEAAQISHETADLYSEIGRLIIEKSFTDERVEKALAYYEVTSIDQLSIESAQDFIKQLSRM